MATDTLASTDPIPEGSFADVDIDADADFFDDDASIQAVLPQPQPNEDGFSSDDEPSSEPPPVGQALFPMTDWPPAGHCLLTKRWNTLEELLAEVKEFATEAGFAIYKLRGSDNGGDGKPTRYDLSCTLDKPVKSKSTGLRNTSSKKRDCPWRGTAKLQKEHGKWVFYLRNAAASHRHNHEPVSRPEAIQKSKRLKPEQVAFVAQIIENTGIRNRDIEELLRQRFPDAYFNKQDVKNCCYQLKRAANAGYTPIQSTIKCLNEQKVRYKCLWEKKDGTVDWNEDDPEHHGNCELGNDGFDSRGFKPVTIWWTTKWCEEVWKAFPHVQLFDNTYKTNNKNWAFSQVVTLSPHNLALSCAFAVVDNEREEGYNWLANQHDAHRKHLNLPPPTIVLTDYEKSMKKALKRVYPNANQQLCIFHVNKNVVLHIKRKWNKREAARILAEKTGTAVPIVLDDGPEDLLELDEEDLAIVDRLNRAGNHEQAVSQPPPEHVEYSRAGFYKLWEHVLYAKTLDGFTTAWKKIQDIFVAQKELVSYINTTYMPLAAEWANCYISKQPNFGCRTTSCVESVNKLLKSFIVSASCSLFQVVKQSFLMAKNMERAFHEKMDKELWRIRYSTLTKNWMGGTRTEIVWKAQDMVVKAYREAQKYFKSDKNPNPPANYLCECTNRNQYDLPCPCELIDMHVASGHRGIKLTKHHFNKFWWLRTNLKEMDPYLQYEEPDRQGKLRGRPRGSKAFASDHHAPQIEVLVPTALPTTAARQAGLNPSIRRNLSTWEIEGDDLEAADNEDRPSQTSRKRKMSSALTSTATGKKRARFSQETRPSTALIGQNRDEQNDTQEECITVNNEPPAKRTKLRLQSLSIKRQGLMHLRKEDTKKVNNMEGENGKGKDTLSVRASGRVRKHTARYLEAMRAEQENSQGRPR